MAPTEDSGDIESNRLALERMFHHLEDAKNHAVDTFEKLATMANVVAPGLGPIPLYLVRKQLEDIRGLLSQLLGHVQFALANSTPVLSLFFRSIDYLKAGKSPLSDIAADIGDPARNNLHYWTGPASDAYAQKQGVQQSAAGRAADGAGVISKWLFDVGKANVAYVTELLDIMVDVVGELVNVATKGATVVLLPIALNDLVGAIKKLVIEGGKKLVELGDKLVDTLGDQLELADEKSDHGIFAGGHWPQAVYA